jgi:hypothetical protein
VLLELDMTVDRCSRAAALRIKLHKVAAPYWVFAENPVPVAIERGRIMKYPITVGNAL